MDKTILKTTLVLVGLIFFSLSAVAKENMLHSIQISQKFDGYHLTLKTDDIVNSSKKIEGNNKIYFELDNTKAQPDTKTIYQNTRDIDGVVIQQNGNKLRIYLSGENVLNSALTFETPTQTVDIKSKSAEGGEIPTYVFFGLIGFSFLIFKALFSKVKKESESGYANRILRQERQVAQNFASDTKTKTTNPYIRKGTTIKLIEERRNKELYAQRKRTA